MSELTTAIDDYTRLTIARLRGELALDDRPRLEALEGLLRDRIEGARPAPRKIENPTATAARPSMNVKPAQVTVTRRGPGEGGDPASAGPSIAPVSPASIAPRPPRSGSVAAPPPTPAPTPAPTRSREPERPREPERSREPAWSVEPEAPALSALDRSKLNEISSRSLPRTSYTPSVSPLFMEDYYESTLAPDHSLSGNDKAHSVLALGDETMALPEEARMFLGVADARFSRAPSQTDGGFARPIPDEEDGELTELRGDGEETEAREPIFNTTPNARPAFAQARNDSLTAAAPPPPARAAPRTAPPPPAPPPAPASVAPSRAPAPAPTSPAPAPRTTARPPPPTSMAAPARAITPIIVQLLGGETKRGELVAFDPEAGVVSLRATPQALEESLDINEVFAVFVGHARGVAPMPATGTRIAVRMTNDREVVGVSPDYAPGANAMTLVPDDRRTVDRIWIPAWSVTEIRFA